MYNLDKYRDTELDACNLYYWLSPGSWQTWLYFFYKVFVKEQVSSFCSKEHKPTNPVRRGLHSELNASPSEISLPMSVSQWSWGCTEAAFPWLPVTLLNATSSRNTCHLGCCPIFSQGDSSHPSLCLWQQTCFLHKHCSWWITVWKYHVLCRKLVKQREIVIFCVSGWTKFHLGWPSMSLSLSFAPLHFSIPCGITDAQHYCIYQRGDSICVTIQLDDSSAFSEAWRIFNVRKSHN